jgi:hypothetical protein
VKEALICRIDISLDMAGAVHAKARSKMSIDGNLLGPCGFYCGRCLAFKKGKCLGCRYQADKRHAEGMKNWCPLLNCAEKRGMKMCSDCDKFPCMKQYNPDKDGMFSWLYFNYIKNEIKPE